VTIAVKWSNFVLCRKGKALCERPFTLHHQQPEKYKQNWIHFCGRSWKGVWGHSNESLPFNAVRYVAERSFSKLNLIKTFHRSAMTDEMLINLAMISIESETAKTLGMTELTETFAFMKTWKKSFSSLET